MSLSIYLSHLNLSHDSHTSAKSLISSFPGINDRTLSGYDFISGQIHLHYLVDFLLCVCEKCCEVAESITVEHHLGLFIRASHYVPNSPEGSGLDARKKDF